MTSEVRIKFGGLEESPTRGGTVILRGVIDAANLGEIKFADYQREIQPLSARESIMNALTENEALPDVELGMRGQKFRMRGEDYFLQDDVYCIDGLQRISTAMAFQALHPQANVRIGACVHFDTTESWEKERFHLLNANQRKVSPNVLLRNMRDQHRPLSVLYGLSHQQGFVLNNRVCWNQSMARGQLVTALLYLKVANALHSHLGPGLSNSLKEIVAALVRLENDVGMQHMRENAAQFFNVVDECFGIRNIEIRACATHLRGTFLLTLARVFASHTDFWRGGDKQLFLDADMRRKLRTFPMQDGQIKHLAGAGGQAGELLYQLMVAHLNKRRSKKLTLRGSEQRKSAPRKTTPNSAEHVAAPTAT